MKKILTTCSALLLALVVMGQTASFWSPLQKNDWRQTPEYLPKAFRSHSLAFGEMVNYLRQAPMKLTAAAKNAPLLVELPMPDGTMAAFEVWESPVMEPGLAERFPAIKSYAGRGFNNPEMTTRFGVNHQGFHAIIHTNGKTALLNAVAEGISDQYMAYWLHDVDLSSPEATQYGCDVADEPFHEAGFTENTAASGQRAQAPVDLYTYRIAVATTVEYSSDHGNTVSSVLDAVTTVIENVNSVFERDVAVELVLVDSTDKTFFFGAPLSDDYNNGNTGLMIDQNADVMNDNYALSHYDIGHAFGTDGGGLAQLASVCNGNSALGTPKARGVSCSFGPYTTNLFYIIVGHEIGHQFNAQHTFNKCDDMNESADTAYEPGSGSSIMCYNGNGVCGDNHIQAITDDYFHNNAMQRINAFTRTGGGSSCAEVVSVGNNTPEATIPITGGFYIPISTPFELTGSATDVDGDDLTYIWEQYDLGPPSPLGSPITTAPLFRSFPPSTSPTRVFPRMVDIVNNVSDIREVLPTISRPLTFHFVVRDNNEDAGAYDIEPIEFLATAAAGPFLVTNPNTALTYTVGDYEEVTWDVANSDLAPVNCKHVNIKMSLDGGFTYPITLLANTANDGSAFVVIPNNVTTQARVRVEAADNIFFDISNTNFTIVPPAQPTYLLNYSPDAGIACDEFVINLTTEALLGFDQPITFAVNGLPAGATATFSQNPVNPGQGSMLTLNTAGTTFTGDATISIVGTSAGQPDQVRNIVVQVVETDLSGIAAVAPADGASGMQTLPNFAWTDLPNALLYDIEISTDPSFATIVDSEAGLTAANWTPNITLADNSIYYWRVRASNECGTGEFADAASFHTVSQSCFELPSTDNNKAIPGTGLPIITSVINVPQAGTISEVRVPNVKGTHNAVGDLEFRLKGPDGTTVVLMSEPACNSQGFDCGFSSNSPTVLTNCPTPGLSYKPVGDLGNFNGKNSQGNWTFECAVVNSLGEGGTFQTWELLVCAGLQPNNPFKVINDTLYCPPGDSRLIYQDKLKIDDSDNMPSELEFTIVKNTAHGFVSLNGNQLGVGDHFTMLDVYASAVEYTNTNTAASYDYFTFSVNDGTGGFFGTPRFNIVMDPNAPPSSVNDLLDSKQVSVFPNPTSGNVTVEFLHSTIGEVQVTVFNAQGQLMMADQIGNGSSTHNLRTAHLPAGVYLLHFATAEGVYVKKLVKE